MRMMLLAAVLVALAGPAEALAQKGKGKSDADFLKEKPSVGDVIPDVTAYDPSGKEVKTSSLRGHHTVLVFGCLT